MSKVYNVDYFSTDDVLFQLSKKTEGPVMYIRADGPNNCQDKSKLDEIWEFYLGKCDDSILALLMQKGEAYCYFLTDNQARECFYDWFPQKSDLEESEMDYYIYARLLNVSSEIDVENG